MNNAVAIVDAINGEGFDTVNGISQQIAADDLAAFESRPVIQLDELRFVPWGNNGIEPVGVAKRASAGMNSIVDSSSTTFDIVSVRKVKGQMSDFDLVYEVQTRYLEKEERPGSDAAIGGRAATLRTTFVVHMTNSGCLDEGYYAHDGEDITLEVYSSQGDESTIFCGDVEKLHWDNPIARCHRELKAKFAWDLAFREDMRTEFI